MLRRPPLSTLTDPLFPSTPLFRSAVDYAVTGEVDGADFVGGLLPGGTLTFAAGEASKTLSFNVAGDGDEEPDEDFTVTLSNASRSEEHTSELQSLMRISYAVFCLKKKKQTTHPILDRQTNTH